MSADRDCRSSSVINSGVLKLSVLTPITKVYRGAAGMKMPKNMLEPNSFGFKLGIEFGFMSTTTDRSVALQYGQVTRPLV